MRPLPPISDIPFKDKGERLSASHMNAIREVCQDYLSRTKSHPWADKGIPPFKQRIVEITKIVNATRGWYEVRPRFISHLESTIPWRTETAAEHGGWNLDISGLYKSPQTPTPLKIGDVGVAYWDVQRQTFVPVSISAFQPSQLVIFELKADRDYDANETDAYIVKWNGTAYVADTTVTVSVVAPCGIWVGKIGYRGWARVAENRQAQVQQQDGVTPVVLTVNAGKAIYEIIFLEAPARWFRFVLTADPEPGPAPANFSATVTADPDGFWGAAPNHKIPVVGGGSEQQLKVYDYDKILRHSKSGAYGWAVYDERVDRWVVQACEQKASFIRFTLSQKLSAGSSSGDAATALADIDDFWGEEVWDVQDPGDNITVYDITGAFIGAPAGASGVAVFDWDADKYNIILCEGYASHVAFELTQDFSGSSGGGPYIATASFDRVWGATGWEFLTPAAADFKVYDYQRLFKFGLKTAKGIATFDWNQNRFVAIACQQRTMTIAGKLESPIGTVGGSVMIQDIQTLDHTPFNQKPAKSDGTYETHIEVFNVFGFIADAGALCWCRWNERSGDGRWEIFQVMCPAGS